MSKSYKVNTPNVSSENIDGEVIIVNLENGSYYSCVDLGAYVWSRISGGEATSSIVERLSDHYPVDRAQIEDSVADFASGLEREQLIVPASSSQGGGLAVEAALPAEYSAPELNIYSDMKDMLLLDPVHDVADVGWPVRPE